LNASCLDRTHVRYFQCTEAGESGDKPVAVKGCQMAATHLWMLEEMAREALAERLAEGERLRMASVARKAAPKGRSVRVKVADALRAVASRLDRDVAVRAPAGRGLARV
jgi:hypothetical protein